MKIIKEDTNNYKKQENESEEEKKQNISKHKLEEVVLHRRFFPFFESCTFYILNDLYNLPWWLWSGMFLYLFLVWYVSITKEIRIIKEISQWCRENV